MKANILKYDLKGHGKSYKITFTAKLTFMWKGFTDLST